MIKEVKIIRSHRRAKTISARLYNGIMYVNAPSRISEDELKKIVSNFQERFQKKILKKELNKNQNLKDIAERLNKEHFNSRLKINSIEYTTNQNTRWGCCNYKTARILISHRLASMPDWVRDYIILHELAHLVVPNHGIEFKGITARYKLEERAKGFLLAKGYNEEDIDDVEL